MLLPTTFTCTIMQKPVQIRHSNKWYFSYLYSLFENHFLLTTVAVLDRTICLYIYVHFKCIAFQSYVFLISEFWKSYVSKE
jgi:hypothetical protein